MRWFPASALAAAVLLSGSVASATPSFPIILEGIRTDNGVPTYSWSFEMRSSGRVRMDVSGAIGAWRRDAATQTLTLEFLSPAETYTLSVDGSGQTLGCDPGRPHLSGDVTDASGQIVATWAGCAYW